MCWVVEPGISLSKHLCLFMRRSRAQKIESGKSGKRTVEIERGLSTNIPWISLNKTSLYDKENIVWRLIDFFLHADPSPTFLNSMQSFYLTFEDKNTKVKSNGKHRYPDSLIY